MKLSKINSSKFILILLLPFLFAYSYILISNYTFGDQVSYRALYEPLSYTHFLDVFEIAQRHISASEWLTFYILWIPAVSNIDKDLFVAFANLLLLSLLFLVFRKYRANYAIIFLALCNFYVIVLMTGAERLKFSIIFLLLVDLANSRKLKIFFALLSMLAHLQTILFFAAIFIGKFSQTLVAVIKTKRISIKDVAPFVVGIAASMFFIFTQYGGIESKANAYLGESLNFSEVIQILLILFLGIFILENKILYGFSMLPLASAVLLIGGQRVNMMAVMVFIYFFLLEKKQNHPFLYAVMFYFFIKSIPFVRNIFEYGNGFYGV